MSELHLAADELMDALNVWDSAGFNAAATPARPLGAFRKTGGVIAGVRKSFQSTTFRHLAAHADQTLGAAKLPGLPAGPIVFWDFIPISWRMRGLNIVAIAAYLTSCGGAIGPNKSKLAILAGFVQALNANDVWVIAGDMNMTPDQLARSGWLEKVDGVIVVPHNTDYTCTSGKNPRLLDFAVIAKGTEVFFPDLHAVDDGIWLSHFGLDLAINADPLVSVRWSLQLAAPFPHPAAEKRRPDPSSKTSRRKADALSQRSAQAAAAYANRQRLLEDGRQLKALAVEAARAGKPPPQGLVFSPTAVAIIFDPFEPESEFQMDAEASEEPGQDPNAEGPADYGHEPEGEIYGLAPDASGLPAQPEEEPSTEAACAVAFPAAVPASGSLLPENCRDTLWHHVSITQKLASSPPSYIQESAAFQTTRTDALRLGRSFGSWAVRMEAYFCELYDINPLARKRYQGRAKVHELRLGAPPAPPAEAITNGAGSTWWAALTSKLNLLARMKNGTASQSKVNSLAAKITLCAEGIPAASAPKLSNLHREQWRNALLHVNSLALLPLQDLARAAESNKVLAARETMRISLASCATWFDESAKAGYGDVHRAAKPKVYVASEFIIHRDGVTSISKNQAEYLAEKRLAWADRWDHSGKHDPELLRILDSFRAEAIEVPRSPLQVSDLRGALRSEAENKSRGLLQVAPSDLVRLPHSGQQQLIDVINDAEAAAAWPWQFLAVAVALIPKKEGDRGLGILPWVTRLWSKMRSSGLNQWIDKTADPWDDAVPGSSALTQALRRAFYDEAATANHVCSASNLWDVKEFFDSLDMLKILQAARGYDFPPVELVLLFLEHLAPRLLRIRGAYAAPIQPHRSAVAGCRGAQQFARILLKRILFRVHNTFHPLVVSKSWVDDVNQRAEASRAVVIDACVQAGEVFAAGVQDLGLVIADKSRVIATMAGVAEKIAAKLSAKGFPVQAASTCADLGIDRGRKVHVSKPTAYKRLAAAAAKNFKFTGLLRATKRWKSAKKLFCSGVQPQAAYHAKVHGLPPTRVRSLRRGAGAMMSHANRGRCLTTRIAIEMGDKDPGISVPLSLIGAWFDYMVTCPEDRTRVAAVWPRITRLLRRPKTRWRYICGPAAAVISTLLDAGWSAPTANVWKQADGTTWTFSAEFLAADFPDFSDLKFALTSDLRKQLWASAAKFRNGAGLESGVDMQSLVGHLQSLDKNGRYEQHGATVCCATSASWPNARISEEYPDSSSVEVLCPRCNRFPETELHRHWECPANDEVKACNRSKHLVPRARRNAAACPAFWLRGLVPAEWTAVSPPCQVSDPCEDNMDGLANSCGTPHNRLWLCGDGSGGVNTSDPRLRRCGWAWVELQTEHNAPIEKLHRVKCAPLHGRRQTVNRAELLALIDGIRSTLGSITFVSDSAYVVNGFQKLSWRRRYKPRSNRDLWSALSAAAANRDVEVLKIESHLDRDHPEVVNGTYPLAWIFGNDSADELAGEAAADAQLPASSVEAVKWVDALAAKVRTRLAVTLQDAAQKDPRRHAPPKPPKIKVPAAASRRTALDLALAASKHLPVLDEAGAYACRACGTSAHVADAVPWLRTPCNPPAPLPFCAEAAAPAAGVEVRLGNAIIHKTHQPVFYADQRTWACTSCGRAAVSFMRELADPCKGKEGCSAKGKLNLSRLRRGLMIGDSAAAKEFNAARGNATGKRVPAKPLPKPLPKSVPIPGRGIKRTTDQAAPSAAFTALRDRVRAKVTAAASSACSAAPLEESLASSSACPAALEALLEAPADKFARLCAEAAERDLEASFSCATPPIALAVDRVSIADDPRDVIAPAAATADQIEIKRLAALDKRAKLESEKATAAAAAAYLTRATASFQSAVPQEVTAVAVPLDLPDTEDEWESELRDFRDSAATTAAAAATAATLVSTAAVTPDDRDDFLSAASSDSEEFFDPQPILGRATSPFACLGATPLNLISAFLGDHCQPPEVVVTPAAAEPAPPLVGQPPPPELFLELDIDQLEILLDLHLNGIPVSWPAGLNAYVAGIAIRHRQARW